MSCLAAPPRQPFLACPPVAVAATPQAAAAYALAFDVAEGEAIINATSDTFTTSAWQDISARSANLDGFMARGGKLIVPHGVSDPVFSINDTLAWLQEVTARYGQQTNSTVRVFPVPGMAHCFGGPSTNQYDAFTAITQWVEQNQTPDEIIATAGPDTPWPERSRPLCPHPQMAVYNGNGSIEDASNFNCK